MNPKDIPKTTFITHKAVYAYVMLPFGLTSIGSTYQRAMNKIFKSRIGRNLECYVDDIIFKSTTIPRHVEDLKKCFDNLKKNQLKRNPEKCTFGVGAGKFPGFMISNRGIEANPEKIKAIQEMRAPKTQKDVQKLAGSLTALRRFVSKLAERCLPFFDLLKGASNKKEPAQAVGADLIRKENGKQQPVYYVSQVLKDAETRYQRLEKFSFTLVITSRKLRHYFQGREIRVVTNQPLRKIIHKPDVSGRLVNWAVELSKFNLSFIPRTAIKAQALADFIIECNFPKEEPKPMNIDPGTNKEANPGAWTLKVDGSSTSERSGAGLILKSPEGFTIQTTISFGFPATNNQAEYEALISGLKLSRTLRVQDLKIYSDSQIVVKQTNGKYIAKDPILVKYQSGTHQIWTAQFTSKNSTNHLLNPKRSWKIESNQNWMTPFINYLEKGELPEDKGKAQRLKAKAAKFFLKEGLLYRLTFSSPILKCVSPEEGKYCLEEVHEGICGDHMSAKDLAHKIIRQGYYWPTIHQDAIEFVKKCKECQLFSNVSRISPVLPSSVLSPISFHVWGIDIMGPFSRAKGDLRYLLVLMDYMTKWVEAKAMRIINQQDCIKFMDNILMRFRIPRILVLDNGPQFIGSEFESYLQERGIKHKKSSVAYPQGNGQVEVTNRILLRAYGIEAMLPIEVGSPSHRAINFEEEANEEVIRTNMELIDEVRDQAVERMEKYKEKTREHFSKKSIVRNFQVGDLVIRDTEASDPTNTGKLMPEWEGPY
ncbi:hypothetical protein AgCh_028066 [Apium graveolens]